MKQGYEPDKKVYATASLRLHLCRVSQFVLPQDPLSSHFRAFDHIKRHSSNCDGKGDVYISKLAGANMEEKLDHGLCSNFHLFSNSSYNSETTGICQLHLCHFG